LQAKIFSWVASAALLSPALLAQPQPIQKIELHNLQLRQQSNMATPAYRRLLPSLATVVVRGQNPGKAVLIDASGLYLATKMLGVSGEVELDFHNGHVGHATVLSQDGCTQMILLRSDYVPNGSQPVVSVSETPPGTALMVMLERGAVTARVVSDSKLGLVKPSNRIVPLSEIRLELPEASLGGAPVFTPDGEFVGLLSASLIHTESAPVSNGEGGIPSKFDRRFRKNMMGPADLTVAYLPSPDVVKLVLEGFQSGSHLVDHPNLGVFCRDGAGGALIEEVVGDSPAARAGMKDNDLIQAIGEYEIRNKSDFAKVMFKVRAGTRVPVRFDRDGRTITREVTLGSSTD
jgi:hypothetical protein